MSEDHAGVRFPPPFIYLSFLVAGLLLSRVRPLTVVPASYATALGIAFIVIAIAISVAGFRELRRHETTIRPDQPSSTIVNSGPYRFTRNPLYVSLATFYLGIGLWTNSLWVILLLVPLFFVMTRQVIARVRADRRAFAKLDIGLHDRVGTNRYTLGEARFFVDDGGRVEDHSGVLAELARNLLDLRVVENAVRRFRFLENCLDERVLDGQSP